MPGSLGKNYNPLLFPASLGPGGLSVAFFVFGMFFLTFGLVKNNLIEPLSVAYFLLLAPFILVQIKTVRLYFHLLCRVMGFGLCQLRFNPQI